MKINNNDINLLTNNFLEMNLITNRANVGEINPGDNTIQEISFLLTNHLTKAVNDKMKNEKLSLGFCWTCENLCDMLCADTKGD